MLRAIGKCKLSESHTMCICEKYYTDTYAIHVHSACFGFVPVPHTAYRFTLTLFLDVYENVLCIWVNQHTITASLLALHHRSMYVYIRWECCENTLMSSRFSTENSKKEWQRQAATTTITMTNHRMKCNSQYSLYRDSILSLPLCCIVARNAVFSYSIINLFSF